MEGILLNGAYLLILVKNYFYTSMFDPRGGVWPRLPHSCLGLRPAVGR